MNTINCYDFDGIWLLGLAFDVLTDRHRFHMSTVTDGFTRENPALAADTFFDQRAAGDMTTLTLNAACKVNRVPYRGYGLHDGTERRSTKVMHVWLSDIWAQGRVKRGLFGSRCAWNMAPSRGERDPTNLAPDW
ncbi:hypothetical protein [Halocynthiibacter namhaensis]|uniref:hypothetical protein n=1 Tax=Halocynthiibacter namhaensis TaxID=1290553 RepID=UPI0012E07883|nr:hypothetical protein [Halocynthiibacter namhaensis]